MLNGVQEAIQTAEYVDEGRRAVPRISAMGEFFTPRPEIQKVMHEPVAEALVTKRKIELPVRERVYVPFGDITKPPRAFNIERPITARQVEFRRLLSEGAERDLIDISQKLASILVPSIAFGSVAGLIAAFSPSIPGALEAMGSATLLAGKMLVTATAVFIAAHPAVALVAGAAFLVWAGLQVRGENLVAEKAARTRAR